MMLNNGIHSYIYQLQELFYEVNVFQKLFVYHRFEIESENVIRSDDIVDS